MSLSVAINNALTGLNVNKQALAILSQNIANANTPGYSRKVISQSPNVIGGAGQGVTIDEVTRLVDMYLSRAMQSQSSNVGYTDSVNEYSERIQTLIGQPGGNNSVDNYVTSFFNGMQALAETPDSASLRLTAVNSGVQLAQHISQLATDLQDLRFQADQEIGQAVNSLNQTLRKLDDTNKALSAAYNVGTPQADLLDQRDKLLTNLSQYVDVSYFYNANGSVGVTTNGGQTLLDGSLYQLSYTGMVSRQSLIEDQSFNPITVSMINGSGGTQILATGGQSSEVASTLVSGKLRALLDMRDNKIPAILNQLDNLAGTMRDTVNAVHNEGTGFPGSSALTGTRAVGSDDFYNWTGNVRFSALNTSGKPATDPNGAPGGLAAYNLNLSTLDTGGGIGQPSVQGIINEINSYYQPHNKVSLGDLSDIRIASKSKNLPGSPAQFSFDFELENLSDKNSQFFLTGMQVLNDAGTDITNITSTVPSVDLASTNTYTTVNGSPTVTVKTAAAHGLSDGDYVYLSVPAVADVNGITPAQVSGFFKIKNVTPSGFDIDTAGTATGAGPIDASNVTATPKYTTSEPGTLERTGINGSLTQNLNGQTTSKYFTVRATVNTIDEDGNIQSSVVQYRVSNPDANILNKRTSAESVSGQGVLSIPTTLTPAIQAILVDADGIELSKTNGIYDQSEKGYLKLVAANGGSVAIDSLDSQQLGHPNEVPAIAGTNRSFSYYFELNNFFVSNEPTSTGDTIKGSAIGMLVESRIRNNPNLISMGKLAQSAAPSDPNAPPYYTYERQVSDNSIIQKLAGIASQRVSFGAAGGLGNTFTDFNGYAGGMLGFVASDAATAASNKQSAVTLLEGFAERASNASGVNLDEELANTIVYQNAYSASARIITVTNSLFDVLLNTFGT